jgi:hypothetical protein
MHYIKFVQIFISFDQNRLHLDLYYYFYNKIIIKSERKKIKSSKNGSKCLDRKYNKLQITFIAYNKKNM